MGKGMNQTMGEADGLKVDYIPSNLNFLIGNGQACSSCCYQRGGGCQKKDECGTIPEPEMAYLELLCVPVLMSQGKGVFSNPQEKIKCDVYQIVCCLCFGAVFGKLHLGGCSMSNRDWDSQFGLQRWLLFCVC